MSREQLVLINFFFWFFCTLGGLDRWCFSVSCRSTHPPPTRCCAEVLQLPLLVTPWLFDDDADLDFYEQVCSHKRSFNKVTPLQSLFHLYLVAHVTQTRVNTTRLQVLKHVVHDGSYSVQRLYSVYVSGGNISTSMSKLRSCMSVMHVRRQLYLQQAQESEWHAWLADPRCLASRCQEKSAQGLTGCCHDAVLTSRMLINRRKSALRPHTCCTFLLWWSESSAFSASVSDLWNLPSLLRGW